MGIPLSFDSGIIQTRLRPQYKLARPIRPWFKVLTDSIITSHGVGSLVRSKSQALSLNLKSAGHILYTYGVPAVFSLHET